MLGAGEGAQGAQGTHCGHPHVPCAHLLAVQDRKGLEDGFLVATVPLDTQLLAHNGLCSGETQLCAGRGDESSWVWGLLFPQSPSYGAEGSAELPSSPLPPWRLLPWSPLLCTYLHGCLALWWFMSLHKYCRLL